MLSAADFLARALHLTPDNIEPQDCPQGTFCAVTGQPITRGFRIMDAVTKANAEFLDQFKGNMNGWLSESATACFRMSGATKKADVNGRLVSNPCAKSHFGIALEDGTILYQQPAFDPATAIANSTITWSQAIRDGIEHIGCNAFILITPDFKRRLWSYARTGIIGKRTPVYILNKSYNLDGQFYLDWLQLKDMLETVEPLIAMGYSKKAVLSGLILSPRSTLEKIGLGTLEQDRGESKDDYKQRAYEWARLHAWQFDKTLKPHRGSTEFSVAVMAAVRTLTDSEHDKALEKRAEKETAQ